MVKEIIIRGFTAITDSYREFQGKGLMVTLFLVAVVFMAYSRRDKYLKDMFVKYSIYVLAVFFVPIWYVYIYYKSDYEILYRILWLLPMGVVICYVLTETLFKLPEKIRPLGFIGALALLMLCGRLVYVNGYFTPAQNEYHIPDSVVEICEEVNVDGREIRVAVPDELLSYVRQYTTTVYLPYGRETIMGEYGGVNELRDILNADVIDTPVAVEGLREYDTPYLVVRNDARFSESLSDFGFVYVTSFDIYDMYLDSEAYIGIDYINYR